MFYIGGIMGKTNLLGVARAYLNTLRSYRTKRVMLSDLIVQIGLVFER